MKPYQSARERRRTRELIHQARVAIKNNDHVAAHQLLGEIGIVHVHEVQVWEPRYPRKER